VTTKRPLGVTLAAVAAILGSGLFILLGLVMLLSAFVSTPQPAIPAPLLKAVSIVMCFVLLGVAAWGITTSVGLFRMRGWSRWSILVFSGLLAFMGGSTALLLSVVQLPPTPGASEQIAGVVKIIAAVVYGIPALIGAFWLYYFNTSRVRTQFGTGAVADGPGGRPLSVSLIAWLLIFRGGIYVVGAFSPFPGMVFGLMLTGWPARASYVALAAIEIALGVGLLRLNPLSRVLAIGLFGYGILNSVLFAVLPGHSERLRAAIESLPFTMRQPPGYDPFSSITASVLIGSLVSIVPIWFLIASRHAFAKPPALPES